MASGHLDVSSYVLQLGRPLTEAVGELRLGLHRWLAEQLAPSREVRLRQSADTSALSFEDVHQEAALVKEKVLPSSELSDDEIVVIDLSATTYGLLRDSLLIHLADVAHQRVIASARTAVLLLTSAPSENLSFWLPLGDLPANQDGAVLVVDSKGKVHQFGAHRRLPEGFEDHYRDRQAQLQGSTLERFQEKLLRRVGHFDLEPLSGVKHCGRFLFDASLCVDELAELVRRRIQDNFDAAALEGAVLVVAPSRASWMEDACHMCGDSLGIETRTLSTLPNLPPRWLSKSCNILAFDMVNTGGTTQRVIDAFERWRAPVASYGVVALSARKVLQAGRIHLDAIHRVEVENDSRVDCPQCSLKIEFSPLDAEQEPQLRISAYDFWDMILRHEWKPEQHSAEGAVRYEFDPDFGRVFDEFGDWIAYKYNLLLRRLGYTKEVVVVCPDERDADAPNDLATSWQAAGNAESAVQHLLAKLRARLEGRLVTVSIPRRVLNNAYKYRAESPAMSSDRATSRDEPVWRRQLRDLEQSRLRVVIIDEFSSSGATRDAIAHILDAHRVRVAAHLPFVDRSAGARFSPVRTIPLYQMSSPRS